MQRLGGVLTQMYLNFAEEPCNVQPCLCIDEFAPNGQHGRTYSCGSFILTLYNLLLGMWMSSEYMFLTMVTPDSSNWKHLITVYLKSLIEELLLLWLVGVQTYDNAIRPGVHYAGDIDVYCERPTYLRDGVWMSTAGIMGCPIFINDTMTFYLQHGKKACYFDCLRTIPIERARKTLQRTMWNIKLYVRG
ncbi:UNVERIFIED_CONTAM: hypothetical protein Scaly_2797800 [Sesamum calycinum]|uniref:Uncharacterized protein n=1 Tax=Sesamum calycinum TaxID=2727403 RepID=A0AAW2IUX1_9LAMI